MKLYTAILAASLFMYVGVRNGTGERSSNDSLPVNDSCCDYIVGFGFYIHGNDWPDWAKKSYLKLDLKYPISKKTKIYEVYVGTTEGFYATRDTTGKWNIKDAAKALEVLYQNIMNKKENKWMLEPDPKEYNEFKIQLNSKPSPSPLPDTTKPRDTLYVPLFERSDTTNAIIVYLAPDGNVKHLTGKVIVVGIKLQTGQWADPSRLQYNFFDNKGVRMKTHIVDWYAIAAPKKESVKIENKKP